MLLQQDKVDDFVIATGVQYSVRQFIQWSAEELGVTLKFEGKGVDETATVAAIKGDKATGLKVGAVVVKIAPRYFRPIEVETLLGDPSKLKPSGLDARNYRAANVCRDGGYRLRRGQKACVAQEVRLEPQCEC